MDRTKSILISLWLLLSCPFNFAILRILIRDVFRSAFHLDAGLSNYLLLQFLFALIFVLGVIYFFLRGYQLGRTLAIVLLAGSSCEMIAILLIGLAYLALAPSRAGTLTGFAINTLILLINLACLYALRQRPASSRAR